MRYGIFCVLVCGDAHHFHRSSYAAYLRNVNVIRILRARNTYIARAAVPYQLSIIAKVVHLLHGVLEVMLKTYLPVVCVSTYWLPFKSVPTTLTRDFSPSSNLRNQDIRISLRVRLSAQYTAHAHNT